MDSAEFQNIINEIMTGENLDISGIAAAAGIDRSNLSTLFNDSTGKNVSPKTVRALKNRFPGYMPEIDGVSHKTNKDLILDRLSRAMADQAKANLKHADNYGAITLLMQELKKEMARYDDQAKMKANLEEVRTILDKLSEGQNKSVNRFLKEFAHLRGRKAPVKATSRKRVGDGEVD